MDLHQFFDARTAALLEKAIEHHPEFARAIHHRVVLKRDLPDRYVGIGRTEHAFAEHTSGQYHRGINGTPLPKVTQAPKPPKPPKPEKPKPESKPRGQVRPPMRSLKNEKPPKPMPAPKQKAPPKEPAPKRPAPIRYPSLRIDTLKHDDLTYVSLKEARQLIAGTALEHVGIYKDGTAFAHYSDRIPIVRRLELGRAAMSPTVLYELSDCKRVIAARLADIEPKTLPKYEHNVTRLDRVMYAGFEWMKLSEAIAVLAGVTIEDVHRAWIDPTRKEYLKRNLYQWVYMQVRKQRFPCLDIGEKKGTFIRTIDIMPLAGTKRDAIR